jgi:photosystem II stability/assembly factor-like uncharacterized protein
MTLKSACYSRDASLVTVGDVGTFLTRRDGRWSPVSTGLDRSLDAVACCPDGRVVAVSETGVVLTLRHGRLSRASLESAPLAIHCAQDNTLVVIDAAQRLHSLRGEARVFTSASLPERFVSITSIGGRWFAGALSGRVYRAEQLGAPWSVVAFSTRPVLSFAHTRSTIVAVGSDGAALGSTDGGARWTNLDLGSREDWLVAHHDGAHFRVAGVGGRVLRSQDGLHWTFEDGEVPERVRAIAHDGQSLVAVGDHGAFATLSARGWEHHRQVRSSIFALHVTDERRIAIGRAGTLWIQHTIGGPWHVRETGAREDLRAISASPHAMLIVGDDGLILRSTDGGTTWRRRDSHTTKPLYAVWADDRYHALATGEGSLLRSTDGGETWAFTPLPDRWVVRAIAFDGRWLWIGGDGERLLRSRDFGRNWEEVSLPRTMRVQRILHRPHGPLLVFTKDHVVLERDGARWIEHEAPSEVLFTAALAGPSIFAAGVGGMLYRADARTLQWVALPRLTNDGIATIAATPSGRVYAAGEFGAILSLR